MPDEILRRLSRASASAMTLANSSEALLRKLARAFKRRARSRRPTISRLIARRRRDLPRTPLSSSDAVPLDLPRDVHSLACLATKTGLPRRDARIRGDNGAAEAPIFNAAETITALSGSGDLVSPSQKPAQPERQREREGGERQGGLVRVPDESLDEGPPATRRRQLTPLEAHCPGRPRGSAIAPPPASRKLR